MDRGRPEVLSLDCVFDILGALGVWLLSLSDLLVVFGGIPAPVAPSPFSGAILPPDLPVEKLGVLLGG